MDKITQDYVINVLRRGTTTWPGRTECLNRGRRQRENGKTTKGKEKFLWERACDGCGEFHLLKDNDLEVDHIIEIGPFEGCFDKYVRKMYCGAENLQALCFTCHARKTSRWNAQRTYKRKNPEPFTEEIPDAIDAL